MGPGMVVKAGVLRFFSIVVFGLTQIALDIEVLCHLARDEYPLHTFWHTYLGATVVACIITIIGKPISQWIKSVWNRIATNYRDADLTVSEETTWFASCTGAVLGAYSHIILDSLYHPDIQPLKPWFVHNPLRGIVSPTLVESVCVLLGIISVAWFIWGERKRRKANRVRDGN